MILFLGIVGAIESSGIDFTQPAELQHFETIRELLQFNPDVNRSFLQSGCWGGLGRLIEGIRPTKWNERNHNVFPQEYLDTVDFLIQAGAEVHVLFIQIALKDFVRMDLAKKLVHKLAPSSHSAAISNDLLQELALNVADKEAAIAFTKILSDCERTDCHHCLIRYSEKIEWAFIQGAKRGYVELVRTHFKYVKDPARILAAAIKGGNNSLVRFILDQNPDMQAPAANIASLSEKSRADLTYSTPLSEAIDARNETLIRELENKGALERLDNGHRFIAILSAAAGVGDIEYMEKLVFLHPRFNCHDLTDALFNAVAAKQEDAVRFLLDAGADPTYRTDIQSNGKQSEFPTTAYDLDDKSLFSDLISSYPDVVICQFNFGVQNDVSRGNKEMLDFFFRSNRVPKVVLNSCLDRAIMSNDSVMLRHILDLGANPSEANVFYARPRLLPHIDILRIILGYFTPSKACIGHFGTSAVLKAVQNDQIDILELFLNCKAIDFKSIVNSSSNRLRCFESPLGAAVMKDGESGRQDFSLTARLLDAGCDINSISHIDYDDCDRRIIKTPLLKAIETKNRLLVEFLIERGAYVSKEATRGIKRTPIQAAAEIGSLDIVGLLLQNGADVNEKPAPFHGATTLQCVAMGGYCNVAVFLLDQNANLFAPPSTFGGRWPIEGAAEYGRLDMIQLLWNASLVGFPIEQCRKAMELAKENGHGGCADLIRELAVSNGIMPTLEGS